jgi:hypothetical protein
MYQNFFQDIPFAIEWWSVLLFVWIYVWKGLALWKAGRRGAKWWFVALLVINTVGILEILYIYVFSQKKFMLKAEHHGSSHESKSEEKNDN